ncbi:hypothetical protein [Qipengyuania vesicularis]|uniref:hypothetical protein n=1 Tax=Qipengyuania vesicularis TaxID=2867232 RepID=UPI001C87ABFA|nr:hypothetical protein [Qipengyuania vesicularis]MBX7526548.1 hypothetical protein [Qipengyuania vesicularis]
MVAELVEKRLRDRADRERDPFVSAYLNAMVDRTLSFAALSISDPKDLECQTPRQCSKA